MIPCRPYRLLLNLYLLLSISAALGFEGRETPLYQKSSDLRQKIYLTYRSPQGFHRQLLVTRDPNTTTGFDLGYDAPMMENNREDMYWMISDKRFVIQGVPDFDKSRSLPLGLRTRHEGMIRIQIDKLLNIPNELNIYLKDTETNTFHDLRASAFEIPASEGSFEDRFSLEFEIPEEKNPERQFPDRESEGSGATSGMETARLPDVWSSNPQIGLLKEVKLSFSNLNTEIQISNPKKLQIVKGVLYNAAGQKMTEYPAMSSEPSEAVQIGHRPSGVYLFKLELAQGESKSLRFLLE